MSVASKFVEFGRNLLNWANYDAVELGVASGYAQDPWSGAVEAAMTQVMCGGIYQGYISAIGDKAIRDTSTRPPDGRMETVREAFRQEL